MRKNLAIMPICEYAAISIILVGIVPVFGELSIRDENLIVEKFVTGIANGPTAMTFIDDGILVLQKNDGQMRLIKDRILQQDAILDLPVANVAEQGMLGITSVGSQVYLYYTESDRDGGSPIANRIYKYDWDGATLVNPVLLKTLTAKNTYHNGGTMTNFEGNVYAVIGDNGNYGMLQNRISGGINDTSVILRVDPTGAYYAMGIRNSFGLTFDSATGSMWDTENGPDYYDEVNLVLPNFNSGWDRIMGPANETQIQRLPDHGYVYSDPEFSWQKPVAPTGISFVNLGKLPGYSDSVFVGDCNHGNLYRFKLNSDRTGLVFDSKELSDEVLNIGESMDEILFGNGFGCITDVEEGPDGFLYVLSYSEGTIFRILPKAIAEEKDKVLQSTDGMTGFTMALIGIIAGIGIGTIVVYWNKRKK